jgi:hypothetical protein
MSIYACGLILLLVWFPSVVLLVAPVFHLKIAEQGHAALSTGFRTTNHGAHGSKEQLGVIRFAYQLDAERQLSGKEPSKLAAHMSETNDAVEAATIRDTIVRGFYGAQL